MNGQADAARTTRVLIVDNYDSFTHNVAQALMVLGAQVDVVRNDEVTVEAIADAAYDGIVLSPGPCGPLDAGITLGVARTLAGRVPLLGVCLGHQALAMAFGGRVVRAGGPRHGEASPIEHQGRGSLAGLPSPFDGGRYHSLVVDPSSMPDAFSITAVAADDGAIMAIYDEARDAEGLQFHPESVMTGAGPRIFGAWLARVRRARAPVSEVA